MNPETVSAIGKRFHRWWVSQRPPVSIAEAALRIGVRYDHLSQLNRAVLPLRKPWVAECAAKVEAWLEAQS